MWCRAHSRIPARTLGKNSLFTFTTPPSTPPRAAQAPHIDLEPGEVVLESSGMGGAEKEYSNQHRGLKGDPALDTDMESVHPGATRTRT